MLVTNTQEKYLIEDLTQNGPWMTGLAKQSQNHGNDTKYWRRMDTNIKYSLKFRFK